MHHQLVSVGTLCLLVLQVLPSAAADSPADLDAYCRAVHGYGAFQTLDRRDNGFMYTIGTAPGRGMAHHKMQPATPAQRNSDQHCFGKRQQGENDIRDASG